MNDYNYEVYRNIMSVNPIIDENYLNYILNLSENQKIYDVVFDERNRN